MRMEGWWRMRSRWREKNRFSGRVYSRIIIYDLFPAPGTPSTSSYERCVPSVLPTASLVRSLITNHHLVIKPAHPPGSPNQSTTHTSCFNIRCNPHSSFNYSIEKDTQRGTYASCIPTDQKCSRQTFLESALKSTICLFTAEYIMRVQVIFAAIGSTYLNYYIAKDTQGHVHFVHSSTFRMINRAMGCAHYYIRRLDKELSGSGMFGEKEGAWVFRTSVYVFTAFNDWYER